MLPDAAGSIGPPDFAPVMREITPAVHFSQIASLLCLLVSSCGPILGTQAESGPTRLKPEGRNYRAGPSH